MATTIRLQEGFFSFAQNGNIQCGTTVAGTWQKRDIWAENGSTHNGSGCKLVHYLWVAKLADGSEVIEYSRSGLRNALNGRKVTITTSNNNSTTMKKDGFKLIKVLAQETDTKKGVVKRIELHEFMGKKFKFTFENSNGTPCGWDYKHSIKVFNADSDEWKNIADKSEILSYSPTRIDCANYFGNAFLLEQGAKTFMEACKLYVSDLYK